MPHWYREVYASDLDKNTARRAGPWASARADTEVEVIGYLLEVNPGRATGRRGSYANLGDSGNRVLSCIGRVSQYDGQAPQSVHMTRIALRRDWLRDNTRRISAGEVPMIWKTALDTGYRIILDNEQADDPNHEPLEASDLPAQTSEPSVVTQRNPIYGYLTHTITLSNGRKLFIRERQNELEFLTEVADTARRHIQWIISRSGINISIGRVARWALLSGLKPVASHHAPEEPSERTRSIEIESEPEEEG